MTVQGVEPAPLSPSEMDAMIRREIALNLKIAKEAGLNFNLAGVSVALCTLSHGLAADATRYRVRLGCV